MLHALPFAEEELFRVHRTDDLRFILGIPEHQSFAYSFPGREREEFHVCTDAAVRHTHTAAEHIVAFREFVFGAQRLEIIVAAQLYAAVPDLGYGEMAVVLRGLDATRGIVPGNQGTFAQHFPFPGVEIHVHPAAPVFSIAAVLVLHGTGHAVDAGRPAQGAAQGHEKDIPRTGVGDTRTPDGERRNAQLLRVARVIYAYAVLYPGHGLGRAAQARIYAACQDFLPVRVEHLPLDSRRRKVASLLLAVVQGIVNNFPADIYEVFFAQPKARVSCLRVRVGGAYCILFLQTAGIHLLLLHRRLVRKRILGRRNDIEIKGIRLAEALVKHHLAFSFVKHSHTEQISLGRPDKQVSLARIKTCKSLFIRQILGNSIEFCVVVDFEFNGSSLHRASLRVHYPDLGTAAWDISLDDIDFRVCVGAAYDILRSVIVLAVNLCMQQHGSGDRSIEPGQVKHRLGLAGAHEVPFSVRPYFHPGVVVVGVRPARGIYLPRRNARSPQGGNCQYGLLAAAPQTGAYGCFRSQSAAVGRTVGGLFVAPVVDFQGCFAYVHTLHPPAEGIRIHGAEIVEILVVDPERQHEMTEFPLRYVPVHLVPDFQGLGHIGFPIGAGKYQGIRKGHGRV